MRKIFKFLRSIHVGKNNALKFLKCETAIIYLVTNKYYCCPLFNLECNPTSTIPDITPKHVRREVGLSWWLWCTVPPTTSIQLFTCDTDGQWVKHYNSCGK